MPANSIFHRLPAFVIFDLDGVLLDSREVYYEATERTISVDLGLQMGKLEVVELTRELALGVAKLPFLSESQTSTFRANYGRHWNVLCLEKSKPFANSKGILTELKSFSKRLALASGRKMDRPIVLRQLSRFGLLDYFDFFVSGAEVKREKPFPDLLELAARRLGSDPAGCLAVGDTPADVRAAKSAGMASAAVSTGIFPKELLKMENPDFVVESLDELSEPQRES